MRFLSLLLILLISFINSFEAKIKLKNLVDSIKLTQKLSRSYDIFLFLRNFGFDLTEIFKENSNLPSCCNSPICDKSEACSQIQVLGILGIPTLPRCFEQINVKYFLFSNPDSKKPIMVYSNSSDFQIANSQLKFKGKLYVIVHGFMDRYFEGSWMSELRDIMLKYGHDNTVMIVDWSDITQTIFVNKAAANTKMVGILLGIILSKLNIFFNFSLEKICIIGHSFGFEIASVAGNLIRLLNNGSKIGTILGLDPAGVCISYKDRSKCFHYLDALNVQIVHSDEYFFGTNEIIGHYDVFLNGGQVQPDCYPLTSSIFNPEALILGYSCNHYRVVRLMEIVYPEETDCQPVAYKCSNYDNFQKGKCASCEQDGCVLVGYKEQLGFLNYLPKLPSYKYNRMYIKTDSERPFCMYHYQIKLKRNIRTNKMCKLIGNVELNSKMKYIFFNYEDTYLFTVPSQEVAPILSNLNLIGLNRWCLHSIYLIEINYMSNIQANIRAKYSSVLCPFSSSQNSIQFKTCKTKMLNYYK